MAGVFAVRHTGQTAGPENTMPKTPPKRTPPSAPHVLHAPYTAHAGTRVHDSPTFSLKELSPPDVMNGVIVGNGFRADAVTPAGDMRETCPHCASVPLKLVLRHNHVIRSHLFCPSCTRCFDALYPDGRSALAFYEMPPEL